MIKDVFKMLLFNSILVVYLIVMDVHAQLFSCIFFILLFEI